MVARLRSLRWRLLGLTALALSVALAGAGWVLSGMFSDHVRAQFESQLLRQLDQLTAVIEPDASQRPVLKAPLSDPRWLLPYSGLYWQIEAADAHATDMSAKAGPLARSRSLWDTELQVPPAATPATGRLHPGPNRQTVLVLERTVRFPSPGIATAGQPATLAWRLVVAEDTADLQAAVRDFSYLLALFLGILGMALLAATWVQLALGLAPLRKLQLAVQAVRQGQSDRLLGAFPAEVDPLVQDFNRVLEQNQQVVARARQMAGNLAHAVKTPLAVIGQMAADQAGGPAAWRQQLAQQVNAIGEQLDWHLRRSRSVGAGVPGQRTAVQGVLDGLVRVMRKVHAYREGRPELSLVLQPVPAGLAFAGEAQDLQEMVGNLLDNACKWARELVRIRAEAADGKLRLVIEDDGPGLSAAQQALVFERGYRSDERVPGSGLGLDIAREVASLYQGQISLTRSDLGGLKAQLELPGLSA